MDLSSTSFQKELHHTPAENSLCGLPEGTGRSGKRGLSICKTSKLTKDPVGPKAHRSCKRSCNHRSVSRPCTSPPLHQVLSGSPSRKHMGGKGYFLQCMQMAGLTVPPFRCVDTTLVKSIEDLPIDPCFLKKHIPAIETLGMELLNTQYPSLTHLKNRINRIPSEKADLRTACLKAISEFIENDDFYRQVQQSSIAEEINAVYSHLCEPTQPIIVRSSGVTEDNYGDAQAGRYKSVVHQGKDILRSCLEVMASAWRPEVCPREVPQPMAIILQQCIDCRFGGVAISYSSLQDCTMRIEYAPGQPKGAVAGQTGITPHRYDIEREDGSFNARFTPGHVPTRFSLQPVNARDGSAGFVEVIELVEQHLAPLEISNQQLNDDQITALYQAIEKLERLLLCPVDVEFGIDHQGQLYLLQVRPVTRLSGAMNFSTTAPQDAVVTGELVSEGLCSGRLYPVNTDNNITPSLPEGAVLCSEYCQDWMLESDCWAKVAGFVFKQGGTNDHAAITLRQAGKPCLLAGSQYGQVEPGNIVTLAAGQFRGSPGAFLLSGNQIESLQKTLDDTAGTDYEPILKTPLPSPKEPDFTRPDTGFQWLNQQNTRLLEGYQSDRILYHCLSPERLVQLSMSPRRTEVVHRLEQEVMQLLTEARLFLDGYERFLQLDRSNNQEIVSRLAKLTELNAMFRQVEQQIRRQMAIIVEPMAARAPLLAAESFKSWQESGRVLQELLQILNRPKDAEDVQSLHDLIYLVHTWFVQSLAPVGLGSKLGRIDETYNFTLVDFTAPLTDSLLNEAVSDSLDLFFKSRCRVLNTPNALIASLDLNAHQAVVEMFETAEAGKGRTVRLKFSDDVHPKRLKGVLKRFLFLALSIRALSFGSETSNPVVTLRENVGDIVIEYRHLPNRQIMQASFIQLVNLMCGIEHFNMTFYDIRLDWETDDWNFHILEKRLHDARFQESNELAFKFIIFFYIYKNKSYGVPIDALKNCHPCQRIIQWAKAAKELPSEALDRQLLSTLSPEDQKALLHLLLLVDPDKAGPWVFGNYQALFRMQEFLIKAVRQNWEIIRVIPRSQVNENLARIALEQNARALEFAPDAMRDSDDLVLNCIERLPEAYEFASKRLKRTPWCAEAAIQRKGRTIRFADRLFKEDIDFQKKALANDGGALPFVSEVLRDDEPTVLAAIKKNPYDKLLQFANDRLRSCKPFVMVVVRICGSNLEFASEFLRDDPEVVLAALSADIYDYEHNPMQYASERLKNNPDFMMEAININSDSYQYASEVVRNNKKIASLMVKKNYRFLEYVGESLKGDRIWYKKLLENGASLQHANPTLKDDEELVLLDIGNAPWNLQHASKRLRDKESVVISAVKRNGWTLMFASDRIQKMWPIASIAVKQNPAAWFVVGKELKQAYRLGKLDDYSPPGRAIESGSEPFIQSQNPASRCTLL